MEDYSLPEIEVGGLYEPIKNKNGEIVKLEKIGHLKDLQQGRDYVVVDGIIPFLTEEGKRRLQDI